MTDSTTDRLPAPGLSATYAGWADHQERLLDLIGSLTDEQMQLRPSADRWAIWQLASNMAGARTYWLHDVLREGDERFGRMLRVTTPTVPEVPVEDAGWEDDESTPRTAAELVEAFRVTWELIDECVHRWTAEDLEAEFVREYRGIRRIVTRGWVLWHLMEHELQHGTEIALILRQHGLPTLDL